MLANHIIYFFFVVQVFINFNLNKYDLNCFYSNKIGDYMIGILYNTTFEDYNKNYKAVT